MKKGIMFGLLGLALVSIVAAGASAFGFGFGQSEDIRTAIENNNYGAWKTAMESELTEDNFNMIVERQQSRLRKRADMGQMRTAIENNDYGAYVSAVESLTSAQTLSKEDFNKLVEMHQADGEYGMPHEFRAGIMPHDGFSGFGRV